MSFCGKCGKKLPEGVTVCDCEVQQSSEYVATGAPVVNGMPDVAPVTNATPYVTPVTPTAPVAPTAPVTNEVPNTAPVANVLPNEAPVAQASAASSESPFVVPMGNNGFYGGMPAGNGAPMGIPAVPVNNSGDSDEDYLNATKDCKIINILGIVMFLAGVVSVLFINEWVAAIIFFIGEFFVLFPKMRVQKLCKTKNPTADKKTQRKIEKEAVKNIKAKNKHFIIASVIAYVCLAGLIVSFIVPVPLIREKKKDSDGMSYTFEGEATTQNDQSVTDTVGAGESDDSSSGVNDGYAVDVVVGGYDYLLSTNLDATAQVSPSYPYASYLNFNEDGTGNLTVKTGSSSGDFGLYETTWEYIGMENDMRKYLVTLHTDEFVYVYYVEEEDICLMNAGTSINGYTRVRGSAQDNISGVTTSSAYDVEGSFTFSYAFDSATQTETESPTVPYVYSLVFGSGNMFFITIKTSSGFENGTGTWEYVQEKNGVYFYDVEVDGSRSLEVYYDPSMDSCMMIDNDFLVWVFERS